MRERRQRIDSAVFNYKIAVQKPLTSASEVVCYTLDARSRAYIFIDLNLYKEAQRLAFFQFIALDYRVKKLY